MSIDTETAEKTVGLVERATETLTRQAVARASGKVIRKKKGRYCQHGKAFLSTSCIGKVMILQRNSCDRPSQ
jgi:hypothetical protein